MASSRLLTSPPPAPPFSSVLALQHLPSCRSEVGLGLYFVSRQAGSRVQVESAIKTSVLSNRAHSHRHHLHGRQYRHEFHKNHNRTAPWGYKDAKDCMDEKCNCFTSDFFHLFQTPTRLIKRLNDSGYYRYYPQCRSELFVFFLHAICTDSLLQDFEISRQESTTYC